MHEEPESIDITIKKKAHNIAGVMATVMLVAPYMISISSYEWTTDIQLSGILWSIWLQGGLPPMPPYYAFSFMLFNALLGLPNHIPKFAFVYMIYRYYMGKTTRKRAMIVGLISEIWWWIPNLLVMIIMSSPYGYYLTLPIPILFLLGIIIMLKIPAPDIETPWKGFREEADWWEKPPKKEVKVDEIERKEPHKKEKAAKKKEPPPPPDDEPW